jgi:hypothetical protein
MDMMVLDNNVRTLVSDKLIAKLDWNINDNHKLSLKHSYVTADELQVVHRQMPSTLLMEAKRLNL